MPNPAAALTALCVFLLAAAGGAQTGGEVVPASPEEPVYKVFFESGYYTQALDYIEARLPEVPDSQWVDLQKYRAFCLIVLDRQDQATEAFVSILDRDPGFGLDPIYTSPKIFEVFHTARGQWQAAHPDTTRMAPAVDSVRTVAPDTAAADSLSPLVYRTPLYLLPGGAGQFHNGQRLKGWVLLGTQVACLAASIVSYAQRHDRYDPQYGWYEGNRDAYEDYTLAYRVEFGTFLAAYLYGVVDAFVVGRRGGRERAAATGEAR
jgi:hypothetical protein